MFFGFGFLFAILRDLREASDAGRSTVRRNDWHVNQSVACFAGWYGTIKLQFDK